MPPPEAAGIRSQEVQGLGARVAETRKFYRAETARRSTRRERI